MILSGKYKKTVLITFTIVVSIICLILILQLVVSNIVSGKVENALANKKDIRYTINVGKSKVNLFTITLIFKDIQIIPDSALVAQLKNTSNSQRRVFNIEIPVLRIRNISVIDLLSNREIDIGSFILKNASIVMYMSGKSKEKRKSLPRKTKQGLVNVDSIVIPGIGGGEVSKFWINNFSFTVIDVENGDTTLSARNLDLSFDNIRLIKNTADSTSFRLKVKDVDFEMANDRFYLPGGKYVLSFKDVNYNMIDTRMTFNGLEIKPRYKRSKMVGLSKYQYEIYNLVVNKITIDDINLRQIVQQSRVFLKDVEIEGMMLKIFKDKNRPFDESKRPKLPQQLLADLKNDLYIDGVNIKNSTLIYSEQHKLMDEPMKVTLANLDVKVKNVTSVVDSIINGIDMSVDLSARLQNSIDMNLSLLFPMKSISDTFMFSGYLDKGNMKIFNPVVLPAIGVKFESGNLDKIKFRATANPDYAIGEMTMLYHDLEGSVQRQDMVETNKFLSWVANSVIISNNPAKDKKEPRVVPMFFERVPYKGLGNFLWKTLQSGITATIVPTMSKKVQSRIDETLGTDPKVIRKREREERRRKRKSK